MLVRTLKTFQGTHILGASRGLLCESSAVLLGVVSVIISDASCISISACDVRPTRVPFQKVKWSMSVFPN